jgi:beta-lactamase regulating signal transducer with metallopeptidase domain
VNPSLAGSGSLLPAGLPARLLPFLALLWAAGVTTALGRLVIGLILVTRLKNSSRPAGPLLSATALELAAHAGIRGRLLVRETSRLLTPVVIGVLRPVLLLPAGISRLLPGVQLEAVLAHELAHIRRHDYLVNLLQRLAETLLFHHPAAWWLASIIRTEREHLCDDTAVRITGGNALPLARALATLESARRLPGPVIAASGSPRAGTLHSRVARLIGRQPGRRRRMPGSRTAAPALLLAFLALLGPAIAEMGGNTGPGLPADTLLIHAEWVGEQLRVTVPEVAGADSLYIVAEPAPPLTAEFPSLGVATPAWRSVNLLQADDLPQGVPYFIEVRALGVIPEGTAVNEAEALARGTFGPVLAPEPGEDAPLFTVRLGRITDNQGDTEFEFTVMARYALQEAAEVTLTAPDGRIIARRELLPHVGEQHSLTVLTLPWSGSGPYRAALYRQGELIQELTVEVPDVPPLELPTGLKLTAAGAGEDGLPLLPASRPGFLAWDAVPGADHYEVELETGMSVSYIRSVTEPELELDRFGPVDLTPGRYQISVSAVRGAGRVDMSSQPVAALREITTSEALHLEVIPAAGN